MSISPHLRSWAGLMGQTLRTSYRRLNAGLTGRRVKDFVKRHYKRAMAGAKEG